MLNNSYFTLISTSWAFPMAVRIRDNLNKIISKEKESLKSKENLTLHDKEILQVIIANEERHKEAKALFYGKYPQNFGEGPIYITPVDYVECPDFTHIPIIKQSIRNTDAFLVSSFDAPIELQNKIRDLWIDIKASRVYNTVELADACEIADVRSDGGRLIGLFPKLKGTRGEHTKGREPNLARVFLKTMRQYFDKIIALDVHNEAIAGFQEGSFLEPLYASRVFIDYIRNNLDIDIVASTDEGGVRRAVHYGHILNKPVIVGLKQRVTKGKVKHLEIHGNVRGKSILFVDDILSSGGTLEKAILKAIEKQASKVYVAITHALFNRDAVERFKGLVKKYPKQLDKFLIVSDSIIHESLPDYVAVVSIYGLIAEAAWYVHTGRSLSALYSDMPENPRLT